MASAVNSEASDVKAALTEEEPAGVWEGVRACQSVQKAPGLRSRSSDHFTRLPFPDCSRAVGSPRPPPASPSPPTGSPISMSCLPLPPTASPISTVCDLALDLQGCPHLHVHVHNLKLPLHQQRNNPHKSTTRVPGALLLLKPVHQHHPIPTWPQASLSLCPHESTELGRERARVLRSELPGAPLLPILLHSHPLQPEEQPDPET